MRTWQKLTDRFPSENTTEFYNTIDPKRTPGSRRSISAFGGKGPCAVYLAGGLIGGGRVRRHAWDAHSGAPGGTWRHHDAHAVQRQA